jgi:hypothetical protein
MKVEKTADEAVFLFLAGQRRERPGSQAISAALLVH